ncbi:Translin [Ceratobasidium sp. AG-Ba]|nr:Translin [Ceratobasidium sp. AG-Ba]
MNSEDLQKLSRDFEAESELRDTIRKEVLELDRKSRSASGIMNKIHSTKDVKPLVEESSVIVESCREELEKLASVLPPNQFWRWKDMWTRSLTSILFVAALNEYLSTERLITLPECERRLQVQPEWKGKLQIAPEDYLHAIIALVNELPSILSRSVTSMPQSEYPSSSETCSAGSHWYDSNYAQPQER